MYQPKKEIYSALKGINPKYSVSQGSQAVFNKVPAITFWIGGNNPSYELDKQIYRQDIEVVVDIFANRSEEASSIISEVEAVMRKIDYLLTANMDVPNPDGALYHANLRFSGLKIPN